MIKHCLAIRATPVLKRKLQRPPSRKFAQISRAERLKFTQKSAGDTRFTGPASQNAILETSPGIILSRAERLKFTQKSAGDTRFTGTASQNAILETSPEISDWICQKVPAEIVKTSQFCCPHKVQTEPPSPPLCLGHRAANQPPTTHCGFTLIGDPKQIIIQA